jgi:hypothetical protein
MVGFAQGAGTGGGILVFEDDRPIIVTWEQAKIGMDVTVCNVGRDRLQTLRAALTGFNFQVDGKQVSDKMVLNPPNVASTLDAGACTTVHVQATDGLAPDPGEYKGLLVLSGQSAGIIRREMTIYGPAPIKKPSMVKSAVDEIILTATRNLPFGNVSHYNTYLLFKSPSVGETLILPETGTLIGILYSEGVHFSRVYVNGKPDESQEGVVMLPIRVEGLNSVGTYSGKLALVDTDDLAEIKIQVTDLFVWPILAFLLGVLIAFICLLWKQHWRPYSLLKNRGNHLETNYKNGAMVFKGKYGSSNFREYALNDSDIESYKKAFDKALKTYARSNLLFDTTSEDFKKLDKTLETAERDAQQFGKLDDKSDGKSDGKLDGKSPMGESLESLQTSLEDFAKFLSEEFVVDRTPALVKPVAVLLKGRPFGVGAAQKIVVQADEYVNLIETWQVMATQIKRYELWGIKISKSVQYMMPFDLELLQRARARVAEARNEMLDAKDAAALVEMGSVKDLKHAYGQLAYLGSRYKVWVKPEEEKSSGEKQEEFKLMAKRTFGIWKPPDWEELFGKWRQKAKHFDITSEKAVTIERTFRGMIDLVVLGLTVGLAILTVLTQSYFGKTFGTTADYITLILLGAGSEVVLNGLVGTITRLRKPHET